MSMFYRSSKLLSTALKLACNSACRRPWLLQTRSKQYRSRLDDFLTIMPKEKEGPSQLRHLKYRDKIGGTLPVPGLIDIRVVGGGGRGLPKSVLITTTHTKYLFNCGEGTQRIATEFKMKLSKTENIFVTHMNWENVGGLLGMGLTLEGMGVPNIIIHGPPGVENVALMSKGFAESTHMKVEKKNLWDGHFRDSAFQIDYIPFCKKGFDLGEIKQASEERELEQTVFVWYIFLDKSNSSQVTSYGLCAGRKKFKPVPVDNAVAVAYVCQPFPRQRKLDLEKCVDLGIEKGPILRELKEEKSITLKNGTVIHPDQVLSDPETPLPIILVDCPSADYLDSFVSNEQLAAYHGSGVVKRPELVIHMTPAQVFQTPAYQLWMNKFSSDTRHLVVNELTSDVGLEAVYRYQSCLHLVNTTVFPHLSHLSVDTWRDEARLRDFAAGKVDSTHNLVAGCTNLCFKYRPAQGFVKENCVQLDHEAFVDEVLRQSEMRQALEELRQNAAISSSKNCASHETEAKNKRSYPRLTFLGTGSSIPSKGRNVSSLVVHLSKDANVILDCGEGTYGQLYRHYGSETASILKDLKAVFISHMHADHHMGLFSLLQQRKSALEESGEEVTPVLLLAPIQMSRWLLFYDTQVEPIIKYITHIPLQKVQSSDSSQENENLYKTILEHMSLTEFVPVEVHHCPNAFGMTITHTDGWKLVFSGDTMPCDGLVEAGKDCDILVHEATHEDDLEEEAKFKRHSTTSQAIDIGRRMGAKFTLLNHFSQRYAKIPFFKEAVPKNVGIAFDNMTVSMEELPLLPHFIPVLKTMFAEEQAELEFKTFKRKRNKEFKKQQLQSTAAS